MMNRLAHSGLVFIVLWGIISASMPESLPLHSSVNLEQGAVAGGNIGVRVGYSFDKEPNTGFAEDDLMRETVKRSLARHRIGR